MFCSTRMLVIALAATAAMSAPAQSQQQKDLVIAGMIAASGPAEAFGRAVEKGILLGLDFSTNGTMQIDGRKVKYIRKDTQSRPDRAKQLLAEAYEDDGAVAAISGSGSAEGIALAPVAAAAKRILMFASPTAASLTGEHFHRYIFRTQENSYHIGVGSALSIAGPNVTIVSLHQDNAYGREIAAAFKPEAERLGAKVIDVFADPTTKDFTGLAQRMFENLKDAPGRKFIWTSWAGMEDPIGKIKALQPERFNIELSAIGHPHALMAGYKSAPGLIGVTPYYYGIPKNAINDWAIKAYKERFNEYPDFNTAVAMGAVAAIIEASRKTKSVDVEKMVDAMEGMTVDTAKGPLTFRKEDHQAMMSLYMFKIKVDPALPWGVPELIREIPASEIQIPIVAKK